MSKGSAQTRISPRFKPYPSYKDSGVEWLGEIPSDWSVRRLKTLISDPITDGPHETPEFLTEGVPFLSVDGIQEGELIFEGCRYISEAAHREYRRKCAPRRDDILLGKAASTGKIARVKVDFEFGVWSPLALIRPNEAEVWPSFLEYALKSTATQAQIDVLCTSSTQKNISMRDIPILVVCLAGLQAQRAIAAFLDLRTAKIDALVAKKERLIELLQEKRTARITQAVTKGLDPKVPMKESGEDWLGQFPASWDLAPVYARYEVALGKMLDAKRVTGESSGRYLRNIDVQWDAVNIEGLPEMDFAPWERERYLLRPGDLLVCEGGEVGRTAIWRAEIEECFYQKAIHRVRPRSQDDVPRFFYYIMHMLVKRGVLVAGGNPNTIDHLTAVQLRHYRLPFAPPEEQRVIAAVLDREMAKIDALVAKVREAIDSLNELRIALISAAVTGKVDVRGEVA